MSLRDHVWLPVVASLLIAGCSSSPAVREHIDRVNTDRRMLEDRVYELEYELQIACDEIERLEGKATNTNASSSRDDRTPLRKPTSPSKGSSSPKIDLPALEPPTIDSGKKSSSPSKTEMKLDFDEPEIDLGQPAKKPTTSPGNDSLRGPANLPPSRFETPPFSPPRGASLPNPPPTSETNRKESLVSTNVDDRVTQLYLNPFLTTSSDFDSKPGDDGLTVVVEPRNASNEFVPQAGAISVVLLDPSKTGESARVARWDFDTVDASRFMKNHSKGVGLHLQMTWPHSIPENPRLRLFVRYETVDHRFLQAEQEIFVTMPDQLSQRWTPKTSKTQIKRPNTIASDPIGMEQPIRIPAPLPEVAPVTHLEASPPETVVTDAPPPISPTKVERSANTPRPVWKPQR